MRNYSLLHELKITAIIVGFSLDPCKIPLSPTLMSVLVVWNIISGHVLAYDL